YCGAAYRRPRPRSRWERPKKDETEAILGRGRAICKGIPTCTSTFGAVMLRFSSQDNNRQRRDFGFNLSTTRSTWALFAFATIMALAAFLRFYDNNASLFADEILTYKGASYPFEKVLTYKLYPFYYLLGNVFL